MSNHTDNSCVVEVVFYNTSFGVEWALPQWEALLTIVTLTLCILLTVIGNVLVILSVFTYKPLRIVQNFFIVSLAVADLTVATLVMPLNVAYSVLGRWTFGNHLCKMWLTSDVLCCTASILNLCAIALDRFWAITDPINYAQKRTVKRVLLMIAGVWILSLVISSPPLIGWNDWPDEITDCKLTERKGYVVYSSLGSFYIPLFIMTVVYVEIFVATKRRLRERAQASKISEISKNQTTVNKNRANQDRESISSETNHNEPHALEANGEKKAKKKQKKPKRKKKNVILRGENDSGNHLKPILINEDSFTDNAETSSLSQRKNSINPPQVIENKSSVIINVSSNPMELKSIECSTETVAVPVSKKPGIVYQFIEEKQRISLSKERRAARTLGIIMGVFVVCWLPFFLMYVIIPFCGDTCCPSQKLKNFITWLGYINSVLNPIIYTIFNLDFRRAFRKLLGMKI